MTRPRRRSKHDELVARVCAAVGCVLDLARGQSSLDLMHAYARAAWTMALQADVLSRFPMLVFWRAWTDEWLYHPRCVVCGAWRCDSAHFLRGRGEACTKCALAASVVAEAAE